jgi:hypothetical protein
LNGAASGLLNWADVSPLPPPQRAQMRCALGNPADGAADSLVLRFPALPSLCRNCRVETSGAKSPFHSKWFNVAAEAATHKSIELRHRLFRAGLRSVAPDGASRPTSAFLLKLLPAHVRKASGLRRRPEGRLHHPSIRDFFERAITRAREAHAGDPGSAGDLSYKSTANPACALHSGPG